MTFIRKYQRQLLGLLVILVFAIYFFLNRSIFEAFRNIAPAILLGIFLGYVGIMYTNGLFIKYIIQPFGKYISSMESMRVALISSLGNFFAASGAGLGFRAIYLKKKHDLSYKDYISTLYGNYLLLFMICSIAGLLALLTADKQQGVQFGGAVLFFVLLLAASIIMSVIRIPSRFAKSKHHKLLGVIENMTAGWHRIVRKPALLASLSLLIVVQLILTMVIAKLEIVGLNIHLSLPGLLLFAVLGSLSIFINITPANLGVKEAIFLATGSIIGLNTQQILAIALLDRAMLFLTLGILWLATGRQSWSQQ